VAVRPAESGGQSWRNRLNVDDHSPCSSSTRYDIIDKIGQGGMASVFRARDSRSKTEKLVAIKLFGGNGDSEAWKRLRQETRVVLRHDNIVEIFEAGEHEGIPFIAMEYLEGETLDSLIARGVPLPQVRKLQLMEELCDGLAYAHAKGRIHRNIKPGKLLVEKRTGRLKIPDFELASIAGTIGGLIGNPRYLSTEQVQTLPEQDHRSDIFAVGVVSYQLLSYQHPFPGQVPELLHRIRIEPPAPLRDLAGHLDGEIERIIYRRSKRRRRIASKI